MNYVEDLNAYFCLSTSCMKDMNYNLVVLVLLCRDMEELYCNKMVVLALPCRDVEEELYCNKMVVLVLPCRDVEEVYFNQIMVLFYPNMDREE